MTDTIRLDTLKTIEAFGGLLMNRATGLGTGRSKGEYTEINPHVDALTEQDLSGLYRKSGVIRRAITTYPTDAKQVWCKLNLTDTAITPGDLMKYAERLDLRGAIAQASLYSRWFGEGYVLIGLADGADVNEPVERERIKSVRWLKVFSRWEVRPVRPTNGRWEDVEYYELLVDGLRDIERIWHKSRVLRVSGVLVDRWAMSQNWGSNDSIIQSMYESFCAYYPGLQSASIMVQDHRLRKVGVTNLANWNKNELYERAVQNDITRSTSKVEIYDKELEAIDNLTNTYAGLKETIEMLQDAWGSDVDVSRVILFNQLGKTNLTSGEAFKFARLDHAYRLNSWQENHQRAPLYYAFELIMLAADSPTRGKVIEGWDLSFPLNYKTTPEEQLTVEKLATERDEKNISLGIYDATVARRQYTGTEFDHNITFDKGDEERLNQAEEETPDDGAVRTDSAWGVWFGGRRTPICVQASSRSEAISKARQKKKRGGDSVDSARLLNDSETKTANSGGWVRTGGKGQSAGYNKSKRGYGPKPRSDSNIPSEIIETVSAALDQIDNEDISVDAAFVEIARGIVDGTVNFDEWRKLLTGADD